MRLLHFILLLALSGIVVAQGSSAADLVLIGRVHTMDPSRPLAEAVAVRDGLVVQVGPEASIRSWIGPQTRVVRAAGSAAILPGLIESHAHLAGVGRRQRTLDLAATRSAEDLARSLAAWAAKDEGAWVTGRGWNHELWPDRAFPTAAGLDAAVSDRPVFLTRVDGHAAVVNTAALAAAGIGPDTPDPAGGRIVRDAEGSATGVLIDNAMDLVSRIMPRDDDEGVLARDYLAAQEEAFSLGITTFVDAGTSFGALATLNRLYVEGEMKMRVYSMIGVNGPEDLEPLRQTPPLLNLHGGRANARSIKLYADGALGSRGAKLAEPYADAPTESGLPVQDPAFIEEVARLALARGYQVCVHAIGDQANRDVLDAFERALKDAPPAARANHRFRIEHVQILDPADAPRFRKLGVYPSMQGCHCTSDAPWVPERLGPDRARRMAYTWRTLIEAGAVIANGTDAPVEPMSPWRNFYSTVTRNFVRPDGTWDTFHPEQRMNRFETLQSMTTWAAASIFAEKQLGTIAPGFAADLIVVNRDPLKAPLWHVARASVTHTVCAGELVYER